jgi:hypothetical protein
MAPESMSTGKQYEKFLGASYLIMEMEASNLHRNVGASPPDHILYYRCRKGPYS